MSVSRFVTAGAVVTFLAVGAAVTPAQAQAAQLNRSLATVSPVQAPQYSTGGQYPINLIDCGWITTVTLKKKCQAAQQFQSSMLTLSAGLQAPGYPKPRSQADGLRMAVLLTFGPYTSNPAFRDEFQIIADNAQQPLNGSQRMCMRAVVGNAIGQFDFATNIVSVTQYAMGKVVDKFWNKGLIVASLQIRTYQELLNAVLVLGQDTVMKNAALSSSACFT